MADNKIINYENLQKEYGEMTKRIIQDFESTCFDQRMEKLLQGMLNQDWLAVMSNSCVLKGSAGYIFAAPFQETVKVLYEFVKVQCYHLKNPDNEPATAIHEFDDEKKLQAYEYFHPIIEQAHLLKLEMSKTTKSQVSENVYLAEGEKIKKMYEEFKQSIKASQNANNKPTGQNGGIRPPIAVLDPPQNNKCCDKCVIF